LGNKKTLSGLEDEELVKKSQRGSKGAFGVLITRHTDLVRSSLYKSGVNEEDANDILQHTYIKSWTKIKTFKFKSTFSTWFYRVCRNCFFDFHRQKKRRSSREMLFEDFCLEEGKNPLDFLQGSGIVFVNDESPSEKITSQEKAKHLRSLIKEVKNSLRPHHKKVIELVVEQELTYAQAAKEMGCPLGTIMSRVYLARQEAQKIIKRKNLL